jgi:hypothetical protein
VRPSLRPLLGISALVAVACSHRWVGPPPGYTEPGALLAAPDGGGVTAEQAAKARAPSPTSAPELPPATAASGAEPSAAPAFPPGTRSLQVRDQAHVRGEPGDAARYIGKIARGTRVAWKRVVSDVDAAALRSVEERARRRARCPSWVELEPMGWLCSTLLTPSTAEPSGAHLPVVPRGKVAPDDYFHVTANETKVFDKPEDVGAEVVKKLLSTKVMVVGAGTLDVGGTPYMKTDHGLIEAAALAKYWPSDFSGIDLRAHPPAAWPFAWVYAVRGGRAPDVVGEPSQGATRIRKATRRDVVPVLEERDAFVRIGAAEWIERRHLRVAAVAPPPEGVGERDQWIDVDLDEQVLVAYEGKTPVFATLVSTGKNGHATPPGSYRVRAKAATTSMSDDPKIPDRYEVSAVPWAVRFRKGLYIHGVYWHDGFGGVLSHGCVNVSPKDAAFLYDWVAPPVPDGWSEVEVPPGGGALVRIRDRAHAEPPAFDYREEDARQ